jgi:RHS repeat-associated protein
MKTQNKRAHRVLSAILLSCAMAMAAVAADGPRFRPASDVQPVIGRYLVALVSDDAVEGGRTSDLLARTYGGRLEPFAHDGMAGPMIVMLMRPAQARALSNDARVLWVEERPITSERIETAPTVSTQASPVVSRVATPRTPRSNWEVTADFWSSGTYEYDGAGNIQKIGDDIYRYDRFGRLARATAGTAPLAPGTTIPVNEQNFSYDIYGNLSSQITKTATGTMTTAFAVNANTNQLNGGCPGGVDRCLSGVYDPAGSGNQLGLTQSDQYTWDALGMMTELHDYDANDERVLTIDVTPRPSSTETHRRYSLRGPDNKVLRELTHTLSTSTWSAAKDYVYRGSSLIASFSNASATEPDRHFHTDHLGSTRLVTDGDARRLAVHTYWPFGGEADGSERDFERMKFTSHERDGAGSGFELDYMHARYYDANLSRFLSVDPVMDMKRAMKNPQGWNRYSYVLNNPIGNVDPDGREVVGLHGGFVGSPSGTIPLASFLGRLYGTSSAVPRLDYTGATNSNPSAGVRLATSFAHTAGTPRVLVGHSTGGDAAAIAGGSSGPAGGGKWNAVVVLAAKVDNIMNNIEGLAKNGREVVIANIPGDSFGGDRSYEGVVKAITAKYGSMEAFRKQHPNVSIQNTGEQSHGGAGERKQTRDAIIRGLKEAQ